MSEAAGRYGVNAGRILGQRGGVKAGHFVTTRLLLRSLRLGASNDAGVVDKVDEELVPLGG